jgi:hypothetical protein
MFSKALNKHNVLAFDFNHKFILILMILNSIVLVYCLYLNICISIELNNNLDAYVTVYNNIHKNSLLLFSITNNNNINLIYKNIFSRSFTLKKNRFVS